MFVATFRFLPEFDLDRALEEVETLFQGQWNNGMAAHIVFRRDDPSYFPGPKSEFGTESADFRMFTTSGRDDSPRSL